MGVGGVAVLCFVESLEVLTLICLHTFPNVLKKAKLPLLSITDLVQALESSLEADLLMRKQRLEGRPSS